MDNFKAKQELLEKYSQGKCTPEEQLLVENWYNQQAEHLSDQLPTPDYDQVKNEIWLKIRSARDIRPSIFSIRRLAAAAVLLICIGAGFYAYNLNVKQERRLALRTQDLPPGSNKAFLTLADGTRIALNDKSNETLANQPGVRISNTSDGQVIYTPTATTQGKAEKNLFNTIETPKGGQYQLTLPDGTRVWLNAATKLKYPANFAGLRERRVQLDGEAYFEVNRNKALPFRVGSEGQEVEVLGTHFNISTYPEDKIARTTLLEGSVKIAPLGYAGGHEGQALWHLSKTMKPAEQAIRNHGNFQIIQVDTLAAIAWKKGDFVFNADIKTIMQQISRWYNVTVLYEGNITTEEFGGTISRSKNINEILNVLESTNRIHFKLEGRRITVMP
jgi:transmembrane sensor